MAIEITVPVFNEGTDNRRLAVKIWPAINESNDCDCAKEAFLKSFHYIVEGYRLTFYKGQTALHLETGFRRRMEWAGFEETFDDHLELLLEEQFLCNKNMVLFLKYYRMQPLDQLMEHGEL